jgi:hypothetical protein
MLPRAGSATGLNAGSQPSGTRLGGTTASVDGELCDSLSAGAWRSRSPLLIRLTETKRSLAGAELFSPLTPPAAGPFIATAAIAAPRISVTPATRESIEQVVFLLISFFISHPRYLVARGLEPQRNGHSIVPMYGFGDGRIGKLYFRLKHYRPEMLFVTRIGH